MIEFLLLYISSYCGVGMLDPDSAVGVFVAVIAFFTLAAGPYIFITKMASRFQQILDEYTESLTKSFKDSEEKFRAHERDSSLHCNSSDFMRKGVCFEVQKKNDVLWNNLRETQVAMNKKLDNILNKLFNRQSNE